MCFEKQKQCASQCSLAFLISQSSNLQTDCLRISNNFRCDFINKYLFHNNCITLLTFNLVDEFDCSLKATGD